MQHSGIERVVMNKHSWSGIIAWGMFVTVVGLGAIQSAPAAANSFSYAGADQEMIFLLAGGMVTLLIGLVGLIRFIGWIPGFNQQSLVAAHAAT